jgi:hypothetical protein
MNAWHLARLHSPIKSLSIFPKRKSGKSIWPGVSAFKPDSPTVTEYSNKLTSNRAELYASFHHQLMKAHVKIALILLEQLVF